jgi:DNA-binding transcriptional LysR family regulator
MDTLDAMRTFAAVAQSGSFSAAARRLGISKALASKQVAQLERRLGACLLQRTTRAVTLTDAGRDAFTRCLAILGAVEDLESEAASGRAQICGNLRVAGPPVLGEEVLAGAVASFVRAHPSVRVDLVLEERAVDLVGEGFDLAIRVGTLADSSLIARRIGTQSFVFCASPAYLARRGTPAEPADLAAHECVVDVALSPTGQWQLAGAHGARIAIRPRARLNSGRAVATLVRDGVGIGLVADALVRDDLASGRLIRLFPDCDAYDRGIWAVYPQRAHLPARVAAFVEHVAATVRTAAAHGVAADARPAPAAAAHTNTAATPVKARRSERPSRSSASRPDPRRRRPA